MTEVSQFDVFVRMVARITGKVVETQRAVGLVVTPATDGDTPSTTIVTTGARCCHLANLFIYLFVFLFKAINTVTTVLTKLQT